MIEIAFSERYIYDLPEGHRFPIAKYKRIVDKLLDDNIIGPQQIFDPGMASEEILLAHDIGYYNKVNQLSLTAEEIRTLGVPLHRASVNRAINSVAGTLRSAVKAAGNGRFSVKTGIETKKTDQELKPDQLLAGNKTALGISIGGGYHHAFYDHGEGFCIFNDLAITARYMIKNRLAERVLIIDLDVHQGNGTASILNNDENIFTFSMHGSKNYPAKKQTSDYDLGLPDGTGDRDYLYNLEFALDSILKNFIPDYILYQGGVDVLQSDQLGRLGLTMKGCRKRDEVVFNTIKNLNIPSALTLGGGYSKDIQVIIQAHVTTINTALHILG